MHTEIETSKTGLLWRVRQTFGSRTGYQGLSGGPINGFYSACFIRNSLGVVLLLNQGLWDLDGYAPLYGYISDLTHKQLTEKTCPEETSFYLFPILSFFAVISLSRKLRKRKV